jgi:hypothetical protein
MPVYGAVVTNGRERTKINFLMFAYNLDILSEKLDTEEAFCGRKTAFLIAE